MEGKQGWVATSYGPTEIDFKEDAFSNDTENMWTKVAYDMIKDKESIEKYKVVVEPNQEFPLIKKYRIE
jgi:hypothetical protein